MGAFPSAAAQIKPPEDPLEQYSKLVGIQSLAANQQLKQAQIQGAQLENQQRQIQVTQATRDAHDQEVTNKAFIDSGGDPAKFQTLLPQYGASFHAVQSAKATQAATVKALADSDESTFKAHKGANEIIGQGIQSILNAPPEDQAAQYTLVTNSLKRDPNLAKYIPQNLPPQYPGPDALKSAAIGVGMNDALMKQAEENRKQQEFGPELATKQAEATIKGNEAAQGGGVPVDQRALNDYLKDPSLDKGIANKNAATFTAWKAKQSPMAVVMDNQLGQGGQGTALDQAAQRYSTDGSLPAGFSRSPGTTAAIIKRAAEMNPDQNIAANKATFQADSAALKKVQGTFEQTTAFENTALKNLDLYVEKAKAIPDLGVRFANVPLRAITKSMIGEGNYAAMEAARQTAATETAKVLGSATASGVLSDSQKHEALDVLDGKLPLAATIKVVDTLKQDFANRHQGYQDDIDAIKQRLSGKPSSPNTEKTQQTTGHKVGDVIVQNGHSFKATKVDANGKVTAADPQ